MTNEARKFGVVRWASETDEQLAAHTETRRLGHSINGRVIVLVRADGPDQLIRIGDHEFKISSEKIVPVEGEIYAVGDEVLVDGRQAKIRDAIWHYAKNQPFYLLDIDGKKSSKRYFNDDLK